MFSFNRNEASALDLYLIRNPGSAFGSYLARFWPIFGGCSLQFSSSAGFDSSHCFITCFQSRHAHRRPQM